MGSKVNQDPRARAEKIKKIVTLFFILAAISFISGYGLFSMGKKAYIFKFTGVILLFTSTVFFLVASFMVLHEKEKHAGAYHKPKEELKQEECFHLKIVSFDMAETIELRFEKWML